MANNSTITQIQQDVFAKLQAESFFTNINVVLLREKLFESEVSLATVWTTPTNNLSGLGIIVGMPVVSVDDADAPGPELLAKIPVVVLEEPNVNQSSAGTTINSEDAAIAILQLLHEFALGPNLTLYARGDCMSPNRDYEGIRGCNLQFELRYAETVNPKCGTPSGAVSGGYLTLTNITSGASIYYSTDGSFPYIGSGGTLYAAPIYLSNLASGTVIRWAAYLANYNGSDVRNYIVP